MYSYRDCLGISVIQHKANVVQCRVWVFPTERFCLVEHRLGNECVRYVEVARSNGRDCNGRLHAGVSALQHFSQELA